MQIAGVPGLELRVAQRHVDQLKAVLERRKERIPFHRAEHHAEIQFPAVRRGVARRASQMSFYPPCQKSKFRSIFQLLQAEDRGSQANFISGLKPPASPRKGSWASAEVHHPRSRIFRRIRKCNQVQQEASGRFLCGQWLEQSDRSLGK